MDNIIIDFDSNSDQELAISSLELIDIYNLIHTELNIQRPCIVSVTSETNDSIHSLNLEWRGVDRPTDVLSFECERPDDEDLDEGEPCTLGDIVLAPEYIENQAKTFGTSAADETRLLAIHGFLHLLGYDHEEDDEANLMHDIEELILSKIDTDNTITEHVLINHRKED